MIKYLSSSPVTTLSQHPVSFLLAPTHRVSLLDVCLFSVSSLLSLIGNTDNRGNINWWLWSVRVHSMANNIGDDDSQFSSFRSSMKMWWVKMLADNEDGETTTEMIHRDLHDAMLLMSRIIGHYCMTDTVLCAARSAVDDIKWNGGDHWYGSGDTNESNKWLDPAIIILSSDSDTPRCNDAMGCCLLLDKGWSWKIFAKT